MYSFLTCVIYSRLEFSKVSGVIFFFYFPSLKSYQIFSPLLRSHSFHQFLRHIIMLNQNLSRTMSRLHEGLDESLEDNDMSLVEHDEDVGDGEFHVARGNIFNPIPHKRTWVLTTSCSKISNLAKLPSVLTSDPKI
jgi:hypothetical protein